MAAIIHFVLVRGTFDRRKTMTVRFPLLSLLVCTIARMQEGHTCNFNVFTLSCHLGNLLEFNWPSQFYPYPSRLKQPN